LTLTESYKHVKKSVIAFMPKYRPKTELGMPIGHIIGTGFFIGENGIVATNHHVMKALGKIQTPSTHNPKEAAYWAVVFARVEQGLATVPLEVIRVTTPKEFTPEGVWYGPDKPDIAIVQVMAKGVPALHLDGGAFIEEGMEVATAGFPMGRDALLDGGQLNQIGPTLQRGIISAVLPFPSESPHGFTANVMTQGGASGSPIFLTDAGTVVGILHAGLVDYSKTSREESSCDNGQEHTHRHVVPTNISYGIPTWLLSTMMANIETQFDLRLPPETKSFDEIVEDVVKNQSSLVSFPAIGEFIHHLRKASPRNSFSLLPTLAIPVKRSSADDQSS
jgi:Trypsin-like peptidase domain